MKPIYSERIEQIDILRGFALIGLPFANVITLWYFLQMKGASTDVVTQRFLHIFIEGRFFAIFSLLFGVGVYIFYERTSQKVKQPHTLYYRRMIILLAVGIIHQLFQPGEALLFYAMFAIILPTFFPLHKKINLMIGLIGIIIFSMASFKLLLPFPYMIVGIAFAQYNVFSVGRTGMKVWKRVALISGILTIIAAVYLWKTAPPLGQTHFIEGISSLTDEQMAANVDFYTFVKTSLTFAPIFTAFYIALVYLYISKVPIVASGLRDYGRMAFTNYIMQTFLLLFALVFLLQCNETISYVVAAITCVIIVIGQIIFSVIWLRFFKYGLFEWLWRCGTYGEFLALRKQGGLGGGFGR